MNKTAVKYLNSDYMVEVRSVIGGIVSADTFSWLLKKFEEYNGEVGIYELNPVDGRHIDNEDFIIV